jgi:hypothetical protein
MVLTAGCTGQSSLGQFPIANAGIGGSGGGALYLASLGMITIAGTINASGGGGSPGGSQSGGGGGGGGGMIVIYAPTIMAMATGIVVANGGGGASGGYFTIGADNHVTGVGGSPGSDPNPAAPMTAAPGGTMTNEASGGAGFAMGANATPGANGGSDAGGGGGGGGGGLIVAPMTALTGVMTSPAPINAGL